MNCEDSSPTMTRCTFSGNVGLFVGGGMYCLNSSPSLHECTFSGNRAEVGDILDGSGGGIFCGGGCAPNLTLCTFVGNRADLGGGAIACVYESCLPILSSCVFADNTADIGGAIACDHSSPSFDNCTFYHNAAYEGGAIHCAGSSPSIDNTIIASSPSGEAVFGGSKSNPSLSCCDVYGNSGGDWVGCIEDQLGVNGNISDDPEFCNPPDGNYGVGPGSPCLAANNACGVLIGAWAESCTEAEAVRLQPVTWTAVKSRYR
jgi:predicted outer membrane repeat protein